MRTIEQLIPTKRLAPNGDDAVHVVPSVRSPFQSDIDKITFCEGFRALADKTQVVDRVDTIDHHRNRLTHSLEVASVGRTLGVALGARMIASYGIVTSTRAEAFWRVDPEFIGQSVSAACLAHDIGNPPFGHQGEDVISTFFSENAIGRKISARVRPETARELALHEGNAQGFRMITRTMGWREDDGDETGLNLTAAVLAAFLKYPFPLTPGAKKYGLFHDDVASAERVAGIAGMQKLGPGWRRHPLVWIMEAADDICYLTVDLEDAALGGAIDMGDAIEQMLALIDKRHFADVSFAQIKRDPVRALRFLRSRMIRTLIDDAIDTHSEIAGDIENGSLQVSGGILGYSQRRDQISALRQWSRANIYRSSGTNAARTTYSKIMTVFLEMLGHDLLSIIDGDAFNSERHAAIAALYGGGRRDWGRDAASGREKPAPDTTVRRAIDLLTMTPERKIAQHVERAA